MKDMTRDEALAWIKSEAENYAHRNMHEAARVWNHVHKTLTRPAPDAVDLRAENERLRGLLGQGNQQ
jgi:hypothetical protein